MFTGNAREKGWKLERRVISDGDLVRRILRGETDLFEEVVERHYNKAFAVCFGITANREDSNDLAQEAFINCFEHLNRIAQPDRLAAYIATTARNLALNLVKKRKHALEHQMSVLKHNRGNEFGAPMALLESEDNEMREAIRRLLADLPQKTREVVSLYYFDDLQTPEIAELVGASPDAVRKRLEYGRNTLKAALEREIRPAIQTDDERKSQIGGILGVLPLTKAPWAGKNGLGTEKVSRAHFSPFGKGAAYIASISAILALGWFALPTILDAVGLRSERTASGGSTAQGENASLSTRYALPNANGKVQLPGNQGGGVEVLASAPGTGPRPTIRIGRPPMSFSSQQYELLKAASQAIVKEDVCDIVIQPVGAIDEYDSDTLAYADLGNVIFITDRGVRGSALLAHYIADNVVVTLDALSQDSDFERDDFYSNLWKSCTLNGTTWAVPLYASSWALAVNSDAVHLDAPDRPHSDWSDRFEYLADHTPSCSSVNAGNASVLNLPIWTVFDSYYLDAGGDYAAPNIAESSAWKLAEQKLGLFYKRCPAVFADAPPVTDADGVRYVTDGTGNPCSFSELHTANPAWSLVVPKGEVPVSHTFFAVAAIKRTTPDEERIAWHIIKALLSPQIMLSEFQKYGLTPIRKSVAGKVLDPDAQIFISQVQHMVFPPPVSRESGDIDAYEKSVSNLLDAGKQSVGVQR